MEPVIRINKLGENMELRQVLKRESHHQTRSSLVILFAFLYATPKMINMYCDFYHKRGLDVLLVRGHLKYFLWPPSCQWFVRRLLVVLKNNEIVASKEHLVVHAISVGAYIYTTMMLEMFHQQRYSGIAKKIQGHVLDSVTTGGTSRMIEGAVQYMKTTFVKSVATVGARFYLFLTSSYTLDFYDITVDLITNNPIDVPSLFFYCLDDPIAPAESVERIIKRWKTHNNSSVISKHWEHSKHSAHILFHTEEYENTLNGFLNDIYNKNKKSKL